MVHGRIKFESDRVRDDRDEALAAFGLVLDGDAGSGDSYYYLWPENTEVWNLWVRCQTQWREGMAGRTGLDYCGIDKAFDLLGLSKKKRREVFPLLQSMETAALAAWSER